MRILKTSKGHEYNVNYAWAPTYDGSCVISMKDDRRIPVIAEEFDGVDSMHFTDEEAMREYDWDGYTKLKSIGVTSDGITITLVKEAADAS